MMRIAVLSDTHSRTLPPQVIAALSGVDLIIHAGDICDESMLKDISDLNTVEAVCGNMDNAVLRRKLPSRLVLRYGNVAIGVTHGAGCADSVLTRVREEFLTEEVDVVVFGHSHEPFNKRIDGVLYFNPGSPNDEIFAPYCSYGILEINSGAVRAEIIKVG